MPKSVNIKKKNTQEQKVNEYLLQIISNVIKNELKKSAMSSI